MVTERKLNLSKLKEGKVPPPPLYQESFWKEMMSKQSERRRGWRPGQTKDRTNLFHPVWHTDPRSAALDLTLVRLPSEIPPKTPPKKHPAALHDTRPVALTSPTTLRCLFGCSWLWWRLQVQIGVHPLQRLIPSWSSLDHVFLTFSLLSTSSSPICPVSGSVWCRCTIPASQTDCADRRGFFCLRCRVLDMLQSSTPWNISLTFPVHSIHLVLLFFRLPLLWEASTWANGEMDEFVGSSTSGRKKKRAGFDFTRSKKPVTYVTLHSEEVKVLQLCKKLSATTDKTVKQWWHTSERAERGTAVFWGFFF